MLLASLLLIALLSGAQPFKISLKAPAAPVVAAPLVPLPQEPAAVPVALGAEKGAPVKGIEQQREVPYQEQEPIRQTELNTGVKGATVFTKPERVIAPTLVAQPTLLPPLRPILPQTNFFVPQPQALAYVIIRPLQQPQFQYLQPAHTLPAPAPAPIFEARPLATKGGSFEEPIRQQTFEPSESQRLIEQSTLQRPEPLDPEQAREIYQQLQLVQQQILPAQPIAPVPPAVAINAGKETGFSAQAVVVPIFAKKQAKFTKLKSSLDKIAQSALSKLTLGSSYQVIGEEIVPPMLPPAYPSYPIQQEPIRQEQIEQMREEQFSHQQQQQEPEVQVPQAEEFKLEPQAPVQQHQYESERDASRKELQRQPIAGTTNDGFGERDSKSNTRREQSARLQPSLKAN